MATRMDKEGYGIVIRAFLHASCKHEGVCIFKFIATPVLLILMGFCQSGPVSESQYWSLW